MVLLVFSTNSLAASVSCIHSANAINFHRENTAIKRAIIFAKSKHRHNPPRKLDGRPYITHPVRVASILKEFQLSDQDVLVAAYLHDTLEDTNATFDEIADHFGIRVAKLVQELTSDEVKVHQMGKAKYLLQKMYKMSPDALLIKLADRLDNVSDLNLAYEKKEFDFISKRIIETRFILDGLWQRKDLGDHHRKLMRKIYIELDLYANNL